MCVCVWRVKTFGISISEASGNISPPLFITVGTTQKKIALAVLVRVYTL